MVVVGRCVFDVEDARDSGDDRHQHGAYRGSLLGDRYRRLRADKGIYRRAVSTLVSICRILPAVPRPRTYMEAASAVGVESRRLWTVRDGSERCIVPAKAGRLAQHRG